MHKERKFVAKKEFHVKDKDLVIQKLIRTCQEGSCSSLLMSIAIVLEGKLIRFELHVLF